MSAETNPYQVPRAALDDSPEAAVDRALRRHDRALLALLGIQVAAGALIVAVNVLRGAPSAGLVFLLAAYVAPPGLALWYVLCRNHRAAFPWSVGAGSLCISLSGHASPLETFAAYVLAIGIIGLALSSARRRGLIFHQLR